MLTKAVIPAAGLGTRMLPLTKGAPKEMLPVAERPMIHHVVQEAADAGIVEICIVIRNGKEAIRRYFEDDDPEIDQPDRVVEKLRNRCKIVFTYQAAPRGIGDAILCAKDFVGDELRIADPRSAVQRASCSDQSVGQQKAPSQCCH